MSPGFADIEPEAGYSTLEMLVAFVVLSLALATAVQSISLSGLSLRSARDDARAVTIVNRMLAEDVGRILDAFREGQTVMQGPDWQSSTRPVDGKGEVAAVTISIASEGGGPAFEFLTFIPVPPR